MKIFEDREDYQKFLQYLENYLTPHDTLARRNPPLRINILNGNLANEVQLLSFCLMPTHFHMLLYQETKDGIKKLMQQIATGYSMYFNKRYERTGHLFQGVYKGCPVGNDEYLLHLSRYIHQNPSGRGASPNDYPWSSYHYYLDSTPPLWLQTKTILDYFNQNLPGNTYQNFVESQSNTELIRHLTIDE